LQIFLDRLAIPFNYLGILTVILKSLTCCIWEAFSFQAEEGTVGVARVNYWTIIQLLYCGPHLTHRGPKLSEFFFPSWFSRSRSGIQQWTKFLD